jgi:lipopolysaccharide transport system permease protein
MNHSDAERAIATDYAQSLPRDLGSMQSPASGAIVARQPPIVWQGLASAWRHRELILRLAGRDLIIGYRGSALGWLWLLLVPLGTVAVFAVSATSLRGVVGTANQQGPLGYTLFVLCGFVFFQIFADIAIRAPNVLAENVGFIKKVIFPVEVLAWTALARCLPAAAVSTLLLLGLAVAVQGLPSPAILLLPVILGSYCLMLLGLVWLLGVIGVFLRDVMYLIGSFMPAFMFLTPVFFPVSGFADFLKPVAYINPLTVYIESARAVVIDGTVPYLGILIGVAGAVLLFHLGYGFFRVNQHRIVDAL